MFFSLNGLIYHSGFDSLHLKLLPLENTLADILAKASMPSEIGSFLLKRLSK